MRAQLNLMRDNGAAVQDLSTQCKALLLDACEFLKILDPEDGEKELIELVAAELAKLSLPLQQPGALVLCTTPTGVPRS